MDGLKERLNGSIRFRLSFSVSAVIITVALAAGTFSFVSAFHRAQELQDDVLFQIATLVGQSDHLWAGLDGGIELEDSDHDSWVYVQMMGAAVREPADPTADHRIPVLDPILADGMHTVESVDEVYRVFVETTRHGNRIAVSQETWIRNQIAYRSAFDTVLPFLILIPVLLMIIAQLIGRIFRPITTLSQQLDARSEHDLRPVHARSLPSEIGPFVLAINRLLDRVNESVSIQRRFVADAAHELRSPMTALALQAERLEHLPMSDAARERLHILESGIQRGRNLMNQLLSLSKAQTVEDQPDATVHIRNLYRSVLEDLIPLARKKHIDVGVLDGADVVIQTSEGDLATLVRNLVDNAIRYTPSGGRVDLSADRTLSGVTIRIADTGPGIPLEERGRVFEPFYRILGTRQLGSGLGLAIVKAIADRLNARVMLGFTSPTNQTGLVVTIVFDRPFHVIK